MYYSENLLAPSKELKGRGSTISSGFTSTEERLTKTSNADAVSAVESSSQEKTD